jgi:hypothetical protein
MTSLLASSIPCVRARVSVLHCAAITVIALMASVAIAQPGDLASARNAWRAAALSDYEYGYRKYCECHPDAPPETIVTVRGGNPVAVRHRRADSPTDVPGRNPEVYWTIDGLFDLIDSAQRRGATVRASYDSRLGFPTEVYIDYDAGFIGDELDVRLTTVAPLAR